LTGNKKWKLDLENKIIFSLPERVVREISIMDPPSIVHESWKPPNDPLRIRSPTTTVSSVSKAYKHKKKKKKKKKREGG
jgi:hypothetical protein